MSNDAPEGSFFERWSRRKEAARRGVALSEPAARTDTASESVNSSIPEGPQGHGAAAGDAPAERRSGPGSAPASTDGTPAGEPAPRPLTEADFADVDFDKLDYGSDYQRFMQAGVPDAIRRRALSKLWQSDPIFTAVDQFQDYAGDFTDSATVPTGAVATAYKVGKGFLSDAEAREWERLGRVAPTDAITALSVLCPGYRVRPAATEEVGALKALADEALAAFGPRHLSADEIEHLRGDASHERISAIGTAAPPASAMVAVHEDSGMIAGWIATSSGTIVGPFTRPGHGGRGIASALLAHVRERLRGSDVMRMTVTAPVAARQVLARLGFRPDAAPLAAGGLVAYSAPTFSAADATIDAETPDQPEIAAFFAQSEAYMSALYPAESNHFAPLGVLMGPHVLFLVARRAGRAIGCGAIVRAGDGTAEIKRMWTAHEARGAGVGRALLAALETAARGDGLSALRLETGVSQPEAIALYRASGYVDIGPFGDYAPDPLSLFMEKRLS